MRRITRGNRYHAVSASGAVDWDHPWNRNRIAWWMAPPGTPQQGGRIVDLCGQFHGTITGESDSNGWGWTAGGGDATVRSPHGGFGVLQSSAPTSQYVACGNPPIGGVGALSMTLWIWASTNGGGMGNLTRSGGNVGFFHSTGDGFMYFKSFGSASGAISAPSVEVWHRLDVVFNGSGSGNTERLKFYQDGIEQSLLYDTIGTTTDGGAGDFRLFDSGESGGFGSWFIAEASLHLRARSATEIRDEYQAALRGFRIPDSPLRWLSTRSYSVASAAAPPVFQRRWRYLTKTR